MEIIHGGDIYGAKEILHDNILDYSANINPLGIQKSISKAIINSIRACENYPDIENRALRKAISGYENIPCEYIICGNGSADLIFRIVYALKPKKAVLLAPTFAEYECALQNTDAQIVYHSLKEEEDFQLMDAVINELTPNTDILFICNPNNPTGYAAEMPLMLKILKACNTNHIRLVTDECFIDFLEDAENYTLKSELIHYPNLLILKAFTKIFAMPGIRLGYALCSDTEFLQKIKQAGQPWNVSILAENAGVAALNDQAYVKNSKNIIARERVYLSEALKKMDIKVYPSKANYILFRLNKVFPLKERLFDKNILIRSCANYRGLDARYYRIAVKNHEDNIMLIEAIKNILF